jgi:hypothetical protein
LNNLITSNSNKEKFNNSFIILPNHLVKSAFSIIIQYQKFLNKKISIINENYDLKNEKNFIFILNDTQLKVQYLNTLINNNSKMISFIQQKFKESLFIIDEIDSLINPLQSNLNIINDSDYIEHCNQNIIFKILFEALYDKKNINYSSFNSSFKSILVPKIEFIKKLAYKKDYGFGHFIEKNKKNFFIGIPYNFIDEPMNGSKFTDYEISMGVTISSYKNNGLRKEDILLYLENIFNFYEEFKFSYHLFQSYFINFKPCATQCLFL